MNILNGKQASNGSMIKAGYIPGIKDSEVFWKEISYTNGTENISISLPDLTPEQYSKLATHVKTVGKAQLQNTKLDEILHAIDSVVRKLCDVEHPVMKDALRILPIVTGFDADMLKINLHQYLKTFKEHELKRFLTQDFVNPSVLESFQPNASGGFQRAIPPELMLHSWSGNVPAIALWSFISSLLVKSASIGKMPTSEPLFISLFVNMLVQELPKIKDSFALVWWRGGDYSTSKNLFDHIDLAVAYGSDEKIENLRSMLHPKVKFLPHGHKLSFSVISRNALSRGLINDVIQNAAKDVIAYDKSGCYSPHVIYVENNAEISPREFSQLMHSQLKIKSHRFKVSQSEFAEKTQQYTWLQNKMTNSVLDKSINLYTESVNSNAVVSAVVFHSKIIPLAASPVKRFIQIVSYENFEEVLLSIKDAKNILQSVGLAVESKELFYISELLAHSGVTRITSLGQMSSPSPGWHHDGRHSLLDLVDFVDIENSIVNQSEKYDSQRL